jgi:transposase
MDMVVRPKQVIYWPNFVSRRRRRRYVVHVVHYHSLLLEGTEKIHENPARINESLAEFRTMCFPDANPIHLPGEI